MLFLFVLILFSSDIIPSSLIISSQVADLNTSTTFENDPVRISFDISRSNFSNPSCVFWQSSNPYVFTILFKCTCCYNIKINNCYRVGNGFLSTEGIQTVFVEGSNSIFCLSNHLTSFAVLVDTTGYTTV